MAASKNGKSEGGFMPPPLATVLLEFATKDYEGAEVRCSLDVSFDTWLRYQKPADTTEAFQQRLEHFGEHILIDWNVLDADGKARPANGEGMEALPMAFSRSIIGAWLRGIGWVDAPLDKASNNGGKRAKQKRETAPQRNT